MRNLSACCVVALVASPLFASAATPYSQWRGDSARSGVGAPLRIDAPGIRWVRLTGGTALDVATHDLDLDGKLDVLTVEGGRVVARRTSGQVMWDSPSVLARAVMDVRDVDGDGVREVIVDATSRAVLLDAETGALVWSSSSTLPIENIASFLVTDVSGSPEPEIIIADKAGNAGKPHLSGAAFVFSFGAGTDGIGGGMPSAITQAGTRDYESGRAIAVADLDGDGVKEIVAPGSGRLYAYDPATGALKWSTGALAGIGSENLSWSSVQICDANADGRQEVLVLTNSTFISTPSRRVAMAAFDNGALVWRYTKAASGAGATGHQWPPTAVSDLNGDGAAEFTTSFWSESGGWATHIFDAATGALLATIPGERAVTVLPAQAGVQADVITEPTSFLVPGPFGERRSWRLGASGPAMNREWPGAQVWAPAASFTGAAEALVIRDTDGDDWGDLVDVVRRDTGAIVRTAPAGGVLLRVQTATIGGQARALLLQASGRLAVFGPAFTLLNDLNGDNLADLRFEGHYLQRVAAFEYPGGPLLLTPEAGGQLAALDPLLGTPFAEPPVHLSLSANMSQTPIALATPTGPRAVRLSQDLWRRQIVSAVSGDGTVVWSTSLGGDGGTVLLRGDPMALDLDAAIDPGDGFEDLVVCVQDFAKGTINQIVALDGATGALRWTTMGVDTSGGSIGNISARGSQILLTSNKQMFVFDGRTGANVGVVNLPGAHYRGTPVVTNLDADPALEVLIVGTSAGVVALDDNLSVLWTVEMGSAAQASGAVATGPAGRVALLSRAKSPRIDLVNAGTGAALGSWSLVGGGRWATGKEPTGITSQLQEILPASDVTGDGSDGFLVTSTDGFVYALRASGELAWSLEIGGPLATPAIVDVDGDGTGELAIPVTSGRLALIDDTPIGAPAWVVEASMAGGTADIDIQEEPTRLTVTWAPVSGASSYAVRLTSQFGTVIAERLDTGGATTWTFQGLSLQPAVWYSASVRALEMGTVAGPMTVSDGLTITDLSDPTVSAASASPATFSPDMATLAPQTTLTASLSDVTRLVWWEITVEDPASDPIRSWGGALSSRSYAASAVWDGLDEAGEMVPEDTYQVRFAAYDSAGHAAEAMAPVTVKRASEVPVPDPADDPDDDDDDDGSRGDDRRGDGHRDWDHKCNKAKKAAKKVCKVAEKVCKLTEKACKGNGKACKLAENTCKVAEKTCKAAGNAYEDAKKAAEKAKKDAKKKAKTSSKKKGPSGKFTSWWFSGCKK